MRNVQSTDWELQQEERKVSATKKALQKQLTNAIIMQVKEETILAAN